MQHQEETVACQ